MSNVPEIRFATKHHTPKDLVGENAVTLSSFRDVNGLQPNEYIPPGKAYTLDIESSQAKAIVNRLNRLPLKLRQTLAQSAQTLGDEIYRLAAFFEKNLSTILSQTNNVVGAASTAAHTRLTGFQSRLLEYQEAIVAFRSLQSSDSASPGMGTRRIQAENKVRSTYRALQAEYRSELDRLAPEVLRNKNKGNALSNADRAITLAKRSANKDIDPRLNVTTSAQAQRLSKLAGFLNSAGKAVLALDAGFRAYKVNTTHQQGGNWMREASVQMTGFGLGGFLGVAVGKATIVSGSYAVLQAGLLASGPLGWGALLAVVGAGLVLGFGAGMLGDSLGQGIAAITWDREWSKWWDELREWASQ